MHSCNYIDVWYHSIELHTGLSHDFDAWCKLVTKLSHHWCMMHSIENYYSPWLNVVHPQLIAWCASGINMAQCYASGINYSSMLCIRHQSGCSSCIKNYGSMLCIHSSIMCIMQALVYGLIVYTVTIWGLFQARSELLQHSSCSLQWNCYHLHAGIARRNTNNKGSIRFWVTGS